MTDTAVPNRFRSGIVPANVHLGRAAAALLALGVVVVLGLIALKFLNASAQTPVLVESTPGQLGLWMVEQSGQEAPESALGRLARSWAIGLGRDALDPETVLGVMKGLLLAVVAAALALTLLGTAGIAAGIFNGRSGIRARPVLLLALFGLDTLLFLIPVLPEDETARLVQLAIGLLLVALLLAPGKATRTLGFMVVLSAILLGWELLKYVAEATDYRIVLAQPGYTFTVSPTLDEALNALEKNQTGAVIIDKSSVDKLLAPDDATTEAAAALPHPALRYLTRIEGEPRQLGLPIIPALPRRSVVVVRAEDIGRWSSVTQLVGQPLGAVQGDFAQERFLGVPRQWQLIDLSIGNDLKLPHLQVIAEALFQPARRNGEQLLLTILLDSAMITFKKAVLGFVIGVILGFMLGAIFAHWRLLERGLLPYVVASQTVPILAVAPMVVIWLKDPLWSVAIIAAYLTFFPVTINTLRGLKSPNPNSLELMQSYAATQWEILWKLRFPSALPYIFTALKVSATASVVGTIIAELPSGIPDGLGRAILNFNQYYATGPEKLWAAIFIAAVIGIGFFLVIAVAEHVLLPRTMRGA